jgi:hypothetical protein
MRHSDLVKDATLRNFDSQPILSTWLYRWTDLRIRLSSRSDERLSEHISMQKVLKIAIRTSAECSIFQLVTTVYICNGPLRPAASVATAAPLDLGHERKVVAIRVEKYLHDGAYSLYARTD